MQLTQPLPEYELERGKPTPSTNHAVAQLYLIAALLRYEKEFSILPELTLELDGQPFVPDISIYPRLDINWRHDEIKKTEPPLTVIEILSPKQALDDLVQKAASYLEAGVKSCWIVQPVFESIVVLLPGDELKTYSEGEVTDPPTGIKVKIGEIFR